MVVVITCSDELLGVADIDGAAELELLDLELELDCARDIGHQIDRPANSSGAVLMIGVIVEIDVDDRQM